MPCQLPRARSDFAERLRRLLSGDWQKQRESHRAPSALPLGQPLAAGGLIPAPGLRQQDVFGAPPKQTSAADERDFASDGATQD